MRKRLWFAQAVALNCAAALPTASLTFVAQPHHISYDLSLKQRNALEKWLSKQSSLRLATDADCECAEDIELMRNGYNGNAAAVRGYHPYQVSGDFNGDGQDDFAVVVVERGKTDSSKVVVFNGPLRSAATPSFVKSLGRMAGNGLFFYPRKNARLVVGRFESEGVLLEPRGKSYTLKW